MDRILCLSHYLDQSETFLSSHASIVGWLGLHGDQGGPLQVLTRILSL